MATDFLISIVRRIAGCAIEPIQRELGYLCSYSNNIENLRSQFEMLQQTKEPVQLGVDAAERNMENIRPDVENWLIRVNGITERCREILVNEDQQVGLCSKLSQRAKLSKEAEEMAEKIPRMREETEAGNFNIGVAYNAHLPLENSLTKMPDFLDFESRKLLTEQIVDAVLDNSVKMIGVYGMGGVGKTMLVKEISRRVMEKEKKSFEHVITLTVSQTPDFKNIQGQLADMLGLKFEQETVEGRARILHKRLTKEKSILIVLDDIWENIDLEMIGIPIDDDHTGCKILFTCRDRHVLSNEMGINTIFQIKVLEEDESWDLFKKIGGEIVETCDLEPIAVKIVKECAHLPIAITTVAKALRKKPSLPIWEDALNQLKNPVALNIREMDRRVYSSLKLSYNYLQGNEVQKLFLLCSVFPEDFRIPVEDLHVYAMAVGFLHGVDTVAQGRCRITKLVDDLISSSLLLPVEIRGPAYVKMHDLVRDVAILIASDDYQIRTLSCVNMLNEWEEEKMSGNHTAVYLDVKGLHSLPKKLSLSKVQLLMLRGSSWLDAQHELAYTFFEETKELKGLELIGIKVSLLPPSLYSFANVRVLRLIGCELGNIDMIGELKELEILSFKRSYIIQIPMGISQLTQLKVLDLSDCNRLEAIPPNILSKLTKLEELSLETFNKWEGEDVNKEGKNASLYELTYMPHLSSLNLTIQDENIMPKKFFTTELNLEKFTIGIGRKFTDLFWRDPLFFRKQLCLEMRSETHLGEWIKILLKKCEKVHLVGSISKRVLQHHELDENDHSHLKYLCLENDTEFQHVFHERNKPLQKISSNLERLELISLENLESIIHGHVPLKKLRRVDVSSCVKLGTLFNNCNLDDILNLESISIGSCKMLENVITVMESEETTNNTIEFTRLKDLSLRWVPRIQCFCSKIKKIGQSRRENFEKEETSKISNHDTFFFGEEVLLPNLEELTIRGADNLKMIWHDRLVLNSFSKLKTVEIESCKNIETVFPPKMMSTLTHLKEVTITDCNLLKCIFDGVQEPTANSVLLNLRLLELDNLPNLEYVWKKDDSSELLIFENLQDLYISRCAKLKRAYPIKILKEQRQLRIDFTKLKETLEKEMSVRTLDSNQFQTSQAGATRLQDGSGELFSKLKILHLYGSHDYDSTHLPLEIVRILHNLEKFVARRLLVEEIFPKERLVNVEEQNNTRFEPERLELYELPKLTHFWKDDFESTSSLQKLEWLIISGCGILEKLVPSSASFRNLSSLRLSECNRLTHLLNPSVATTLVRLEWLWLEGCKRMTAVIAREVIEEGNDDEIVFPKLEYLYLRNLSKLTSFHSGKCNIRFPCLKSVRIKTCPEMKVFSLGIVSTPNLRAGEVRISDGNGSYFERDSNGCVNTEGVVGDINGIIRQFWEDNHDNAIEYLFKEKNLEEDKSDPSSSHVDKE